MPRSCDIVKLLPDKQFNNPKFLEQLRNSPTASKLNPRYTADRWLVVDGSPTRRCDYTGLEYADPRSLTPVLIGGGDGNLKGTIYDPGKRVPFVSVVWINNAKLADLTYGSYIQRFRFRLNGNWQEGYYWVANTAGFPAASGLRQRKPIYGVYHVTDERGNGSSCPGDYIGAISQMVLDNQGFYNYSSEDILPHRRRPVDVSQPQPIAGAYHQSGLDWRGHSTRPSTYSWRSGASRSKDRHFGVELEICANTVAEKDQLGELARSLGLLAERDGSLDSQRGIEIIGRPNPYSWYAKPDGPWQTFLAEARVKARGFNMGEGYGMHVSVNRAAMTPVTASKFYTFFHNVHGLCVHVAGRNCHWARYQALKRSQALMKGFYGVDSPKGESASIRSMHRIEVRIFRSCLNTDRFLRNIQFCDAVWAWSEQCSLQEVDNQKEFMWWLQENQHHYPELASFMAVTRPKEFFAKSSKVKKMTETPEVCI